MDVSPQVRATINSLAKESANFAISMIELEAFTPFSKCVDFDGKSVTTDFSFFPPEQQHDSVRAYLKQQGALENVQAVAMSYDAFSTDLETGEKSDAIIVEIEHRQGTSILLTYNYCCILEEVMLETPFMQLKDTEFFK